MKEREGKKEIRYKERREKGIKKKKRDYMKSNTLLGRKEGRD